MVLVKYILQSRDISELNTEIRYLTASARAEGAEIICYSLDNADGEEFTSRQRRSVYRILSAMKREGLVQLIAKSINDGSREAEYVKNKYGEYLDVDGFAVFVKI